MVDGVWTLKEAAVAFQRSVKIKFLQECLKLYAEEKKKDQFKNIPSHVLVVPANNLEMPKKHSKPSLDFISESLIATIQAHKDFPSFTDEELKNVQKNMSIVKFKQNTATFITADCIDTLEPALQAVNISSLSCSKLDGCN